MEQSEDAATPSTRSRWRALAAGTRPEFILGITVGMAALIVGQLAFSFDAGRHVLVGILVVLALLAIGIVAGFYIANAYARRVRRSTEQNSDRLALAAARLGDQIARYRSPHADMRPDVDEISKSLIELLREGGSSVRWGGALLGRFLAFAGLTTLLGAAISFAIFLATYLQVEKLEFQNRLIEASNHLQEASRRNLLATDIDRLTEALPREPGQALPARLIDSIVSLSISLRPYRFLQYDEPDTYKAVGALVPDTGRAQLSDRALSAERGRLLLQLLALKPSNLKDLAQARPDFSRADLRGTRIAHLDFSQLVLGHSDLRNAEGFNARFRGAQLPFADFSGAELIGADFTTPEQKLPTLRRNWADLRGARFAGARLNRAKFGGADLTGAAFIDSVLFDADFKDATLVDVDLDGAALAQADTPEQVQSARALFDSLINRLPQTERSRWTFAIETPSKEHKYLGASGTPTAYLFVRDRAKPARQ